MQDRRRAAARATRTWAALVGFCCLLVSTVASFQHTDCGAFESSSGSAAAALSSRSDGASLHAPYRACAACEWLAISVSPALVALRVPAERPIWDYSPEAVSGAPSVACAPYAARAPPLA